MTGPRESNQMHDYTPPTATFELHLHHFSVLLQRPLVSEALFTHHTKMLAKTPAKYMFTKTECVWSLVPANITSFQTGDLFSGSAALPAKIFTVIYSNDRLDGSITRNLHFYERPNHLEFIGLFLDSQAVNTFAVPQCDTLSKGMDMFLYHKLFQVMQSLYSLQPPDLRYERFMTDTFIFAQDLSASRFTNDETLPLLASGSLKLRLTFSKPTEKPMHILCFGISPAMMTIDANRVVSVSSHGT